MEPYNPYSPPASTERPPLPRPSATHARGLWIKWAYLAVAAITFIVTVGGAAFVQVLGGAVVLALAYALFVAWLVLTCAWIHSAWRAIPPQARDAIDPVSAFGRLFIPLYNIYWGFHMSAALCDALNRRLGRLGLEPMAPRGLSVLGCSIQLAANLGRTPYFAGIAPFITVIGNGIWFNYMLECDKARVILSEHGAHESADE